jgi:hypothetical protein
MVIIAIKLETIPGNPYQHITKTFEEKIRPLFGTWVQE